MFLLFLLLLVGVFFLLRHSVLGGPPSWVRQQSPEHEARRILAERFARGDISSDDFLERASVLNWNPGSEVWRQGPRRNRH